MRESSSLLDMADGYEEPNRQHVRERLAKWIDYMLLVTGLDQKRLAKMLDVTPPTISNVKSGKRPIGLLLFLRMYFRFGIQNGFSMERMIYGDPPAVGAEARPSSDVGPARKRARGS